MLNVENFCIKVSDLGYEVTSHVGQFHGKMKKALKRRVSINKNQTTES